MVLVGTKLQAIVTKMGLKIEERGEIVRGVPVVQPGDDLFWFNRPRLMLYLINFILFQVIINPLLKKLTFYRIRLSPKIDQDAINRMASCSFLQNAFQLAFFTWTWVRIGC